MSKISLILLFISGSLTAQTTHQKLYWMRLTTQTKINDKFFFINEIDDRRFFNGSVQHHTIGHSHLHYKITPKIDVAGGLTLSWQSPQNPESVSRLVVPEIRPFQEFNFVKKMGKQSTISYRFRLDERFIRKSTSNELLEGYNFNFRFRNRIQLQREIWRLKGTNIGTLKISDEIMFNAGKSIVYNKFDQNRLNIGIEQALNKNISVELGYLNWYQKRNEIAKFYQRDILRFTLYYKINLKKN